MKIYLSGGITGLTKEESETWRYELINKIYDVILDNRKPRFFDPTRYYEPDGSYQTSEREVMDYELSVLRSSDLVVVNFNAPYSIGTAMELAIASEHRIPILGLCTPGIQLHPWLESSCTRICFDMEELVQHILFYYLPCF